MKKKIIRGLLAILNSRFLNPTPCRYGFIGNVDAFSIDNLRSEVKQRQDLTVAQLIHEAESYAACQVRYSGFTVIEGGVAREGTPDDLEDLKKGLQ